MHWRIGLLGLGLVAAFVVGGSADHPSPLGMGVDQSGQPAGQFAPGQFAPGQIAPGQIAPGQFPQGQIAVSGQPKQVPGQEFGVPVDSPGGGLPPDVREGMPPGQVPTSSELAQMRSGSPDLGPQVGAAGELIGFNGFDGSGSQTITLVHTGKMQIAVYHIDRSGQIRLVSSRPIDADFSLSLNVTAPLPGQIRLLGGQVK